MRGRSSSAKSRLRSAGYKCNLCGRRVIDAATLERHQKTIHNVSPRDNRVSFKAKPLQRRRITKDKIKIFNDTGKEDNLAESKKKLKSNKNNYEDTEADEEKMESSKDIGFVKNGESLLVEKDKNEKKEKEVPRRVQFECPVCVKSFSVYFTAHKHIQKVHSVNAAGKKVPPNSLDLVQPIRVEHCYKCNSEMRSNKPHSCPSITEEMVVTSEFVCSGCNQIFVSLKSFDMHVAGLHSDAVDSMFFPTKLEFMSWRLDMERQTDAKYSLYGEYESKKIYRCNFAREDGVKDKFSAYFCPSSMVVQDFSKGIQVHFYHKHYDHAASTYTLSSKYKKYSITSFLKNPNEDNTVTYSMKTEDKDLYAQFVKLMDGVIVNAADVDIPVLKTLIEKGVEMSTVITDAAVSEAARAKKVAKAMTDKEITEALELKTLLDKRRRSADSCETTPKAAKRMRNQSLFNQSDIKMSPKILNTFSLASNSNCDEFKSDNGDEFDYDSTISDTNSKTGSVQNKNNPETDVKAGEPTKINTRLSSFNESLSFNDSYKDFIDKNFIAKSDATDRKSPKTTVKTKLGAFKPTSPRKTDNKEDTYDLATVNKKLRGMTPIISNKVDEAPVTTTGNVETPKVNILSVETTKMSIIKMDTSKLTNSEFTDPKLNSSRTNTRGVFSHLVDPLQMNITKVKRRNSSSPIELPRRNVSKGSTRNVTSPLVDPLELNISEVKNRTCSTLVEPLPRNVSKVNTRSAATTSEDPLKVNTSKINLYKIDNPKSNNAKLETPDLNTLKVYPAKLNNPKVYTGPGGSKVTSPVLPKTTPKIDTSVAQTTHKASGNFATKKPKVTSPLVTKATSKSNSPVFTKTTSKLASKIVFEDQDISAYSGAKVIPRRIPELKYEVREQENDCNILVLKY